VIEVNKKTFIFKKAAIYRIIVNGTIDKSWSARLNDMQITTEKNSRKETFTSLVGKINDQTALSGILTTLYDMHMTLISVKMLSEIVEG